MESNATLERKSSLNGQTERGRMSPPKDELGIKGGLRYGQCRLRKSNDLQDVNAVAVKEEIKLNIRVYDVTRRTLNVERTSRGPVTLSVSRKDRIR